MGGCSSFCAAVKEQYHRWEPQREVKRDQRFCGCGFKFSSKAQLRRAWIYELFDDPGSSYLAAIMAAVILTLIAISIFAFTFTTCEISRTVPKEVFGWMDMVCTFAFTIELITRFSVCDVFGDSVFKFFKSPLNLFDLLAVLPWYLETAFSGMQGEFVRVLRVVRLARVLRLLKVARYSTGLQTMVEGLNRSMQALVLLGGAVMLGMVLSSSMIYYAEKTRNAEQFSSIPASFWWAIVTMTTVGYGQTVPVSTPGKIIAAFTMLFGILLIALPMAIVGNKFQEVYLEMSSKKASQQEFASIKGLGPHTRAYMDTLKPTPKRKRSLTAFISPSKEIIRSPSKQRSVSDLGDQEEDTADTLEEDMRAYLDLQLELSAAMRSTFSLAGKLPGLSTKVMETIPIDAPSHGDGTGGTAEEPDTPGNDNVKKYHLDGGFSRSAAH